MNYFKHKLKIEVRPQKTLGKIEEELEELTDALIQDKNLLSIIECSDVIYSVGSFSWKHLHCPLWLLILLAYVRRPYKKLRNFYLDKKHGPRDIN